MGDILLEEFLKISILAYEDEEKRSTILYKKTDYLFKWLTFVVSIVAIVVPIIAKETNIDIQDQVFVISYVVTLACFLLAIISAIFINIPKKMKLSILGSNMMEIVQNSEITDIRDMIYKEILVRDSLTKELRKENERKAKWIIFCNVCMTVGMFCMAFLFSYFVWGV